jgi:hypothetical protein
MSIIKSLDELFALVKAHETKELHSWATQFLYSYELVLGGEPWNMVEIEIYIHAEKHPDPFVHEHSDYRTGQFRIHGAGMDIALRIDDCYGGILLRAIQKGDILIEGPIRVCDAIIKNMGTIEQASIQLKKRNESLNQEIYFAPRVGLKPKPEKGESLNAEYIVRNYRFFTEPNLTEEKYLIALALENDNQQTRRTDLDNSTWEAYKKAYQDGQSANFANILDGKPFNLLQKAFVYGYYSKKSNK